MTVSEQYLLALLVNISFLNHYMLIFSLFALLHSLGGKKKIFFSLCIAMCNEDLVHVHMHKKCWCDKTRNEEIGNRK